MALWAESLLAEADHASQRGVTVCMETHDQWTDPADVAAVMTKANHPAVAVNWDVMHPVRFSGWQMDKAFEVLRPWIRHVHFHDARKSDDWNLCPVNSGDIDHGVAARLLASMPYAGYLSGEWRDMLEHALGVEVTDIDDACEHTTTILQGLLSAAASGTGCAEMLRGMSEAAMKPQFNIQSGANCNAQWAQWFDNMAEAFEKEESCERTK